MSTPFFLLYFILLAMLWSASFLFMRIGVPQFGSVAFGGLRLELAGLFLLPFVLNTKRLAEFKENWFRLSVIGFLGTGFPFMLFAFAAQSINAGTSAVLNASVPMITGLIAHFIFHNFLKPQQFLGLVIGLLGVCILVWDNFGLGAANLWAIAAALVACVCYALASNLTKHFLTDISVRTIAAAGVIVSGIILLPLVLTHIPQESVSLNAWASLIGIAALSTALAPLLFFHMLKFVHPTTTSSISLLIPILTIVWGHIFLDESLTWKMFFASMIILSGTALSIFVKR